MGTIRRVRLVQLVAIISLPHFSTFCPNLKLVQNVSNILLASDRYAFTPFRLPGIAGTSPYAIYPKIAGQNPDYAYNQMQDIKSGARSNGQTAAMKCVMHLVSEEEMRAIADWLGSLK